MSAQAHIIQRRLRIGAEVLREGGVSFRVWAPKHERVQVILQEDVSKPIELDVESDGYFSGIAPHARAGMRYQFRLNPGGPLLPDPASRFQPDGPHGPSQIVDAASFRWTDRDWKGVNAHGQVLYEMHFGTFTPQGTYAAAERQLPILKDLGITCLEIMPIAEFAGRWGWGYDGVDPFAPFHHYGTPDELRRFIDHAHALEIGAILDVVYNHFGPDGNYLTQFSDAYFSQTHHTDWGVAINFDSDASGPVREFFLANARYWIEEFHFDGYRFDATQAIVDDSPRHILAEITQIAREAGGERSIYLINENEPQHTKLVRPIDEGGCGMDALWNDDFHHSAMVRLSARNEAYYTDYAGKPQEFISAAKWGYLYQGQRYKWQKNRRGTPALDLPPSAFVHFLQNHDQIANSGRGQRMHDLSSMAETKAMTALLLLMPQTPMLFQGQEWAASNTFHYFADHNPELTKLIQKGRARELSQFASLAMPEMQRSLIDPAAENTFIRCKLDPTERMKSPHAEVFQMHKDLLRLRREEPTFRRVQRRGDFDGSVIAPDAFCLRFFAPNGADCMLIVNFGIDLALDIAPEPLLATPVHKRWGKIFSTEDPQYGGNGTPPVCTEAEGWFIPGRCAIVVKPMAMEIATVETRIREAGSNQAARRREKS